MSLLLRFFRISRPTFWHYLAGPFVLGAAYTYPFEAFLWLPLVLWFFWFTLAGNLCIYGINDYFDRDTDALNTQKKGTEEVLLHTKELRPLAYALTLCILSALPLFFFTPNLALTLPAFLLFLFTGGFYSAPPIRAKAIPFLDGIFNILYVLPGVFSFTMSTGAFPTLKLVVAATLWAMAMHCYSAVPDIQPDTRAGLATSATLLGRTLALVYTALCFGLAGILLTLHAPLLGLLAVPYVLLSLCSITLTDAALYRLYWVFPLLNLLIGAILFWYPLMPIIQNYFA